jgi:hypothetical protein
MLHVFQNASPLTGRRPLFIEDASQNQFDRLMK